ncbi:MAG: tetratricopeptide repeat protein, partial [Proteobacteria bacterium]|nr:tetratricopeptide repeat protein [Pseudomonadota bacterium]
VVVDLWAPWCGPCRALTPILERVAESANGAFDLVKINIDENPATAQKLGARSIPLVIAFKDGEQVASFVGAQPEGAVRRFVDQFVPSETDLMVEDALKARARGRDGDAETILKAALDNDVQHAKARLTLAGLYNDAGRVDEALEVLAKATPSPEVDQLRATLRLKGSDDVDVEDLRNKAAAGDASAALALGKALIAAGETVAALDVLIALVKTKPTNADAKQAMLDVFNVLGNQDPLVRTYRAKLAQALF